MATVFKRNGRGKYLIGFRDASRRRRVRSSRTSDYATAKRIAASIEADVQLRRRGIIDVTSERIAAESRRPVSEHLIAFLQHLKSRRPSGHAPRYLSQVEGRLDAFVECFGITRLSEVNADRVADYIATLREKKLSGVTIGEYVGNLKSFTHWCVGTMRLASDPLAVLSKENVGKIQKKRLRRAFTGDEIAALLDATIRRPVVELQTIRHGPRAGEQAANVREAVLENARRLGSERRLGYLLALWTGLRRSELRALRWGDVRLDVIPARLELRGSTTKSKRDDVVVLHPQAADALRTHKPADTAPTDTVLAGGPPSMKVLRADLTLAGIDEKNERGRLDLHAMRKSLASHLSAAGVPLRIAQAHLRHSDPRLTAVTYTDESVLPVAAQITALPWLPTEPVPDAQAARMTGTDAAPVDRQQKRQRPQCFSQPSRADRCEKGGECLEPTPDAQSLGNTGTYNAVPLGTSQRVKGLEPSTFTLAT